MNTNLDLSNALYKSAAQNARALTEKWGEENLYCPACQFERLSPHSANAPAADFYCPMCGEDYELKSSKSMFRAKVVNGAYDTLLERVQSDTAPNLLLLRYDMTVAAVKTLVAIPSQFFAPEIIERRKPLAQTARRAGWVGSNIRLDLIPNLGKVIIVEDGLVTNEEDVAAQWRASKQLSDEKPSKRGWLLGVLRCVEDIEGETFKLNDLYAFESRLKEMFPGNNNVRPKIRQQLQKLRDQGHLEFLGNGNYRKRL